jgi:hypothetical protein
MVSEGTRLPKVGEAVLDLRKLEDYCLNASHPRGRHKARVFRQVLGLTQDDAPWLREALLAAAKVQPATSLGGDRYGSSWGVDVPVERQSRTGMVRTVWIVRAGETFPRFVTCWVI